MNLMVRKFWCLVFISVIFCFWLISPLVCSDSVIWKTSPIKMELKNGATVLYEKDKSSKITVLQFYIKGGKQADPEEKQGLSYVTTRLALEIPDRQTAQDFMLQATNVMMFSENDYSAVIVTCLSDKLKDSLMIISDIMINPLFSRIRINRIKENMLIREKMEQDSSRNIVFKTIRDVLFKDTLYCGSVYGDEDSLKQIKKKDIVEFYKNHFTASNMVIAVSTDLDKQDIIDSFNQYFSELKQGNTWSSKKLTPPSIDSQPIHITRDTKQTFIAAGYRLPPINLKNYILSMMLENLIGKGIDSRLWPLRKEQKIAYNINAHVSYYQNGGILETLLETENTNKEKAQKALDDALELLYSQGIDPDEFNRTKVYTKTSFLRSNETKRERTGTLAFFEIMGLGLESFKKIFKEMENIELHEMNSYIHEILEPKNRIKVSVGPE